MIEQTSYVKNQIINAVIELIKEKEMKDINVSEICNRAQVSRISFYRNFNEKEDVIKGYISMTLNQWNTENPKKETDTQDDELGDIFAYILANKDFYLLLKDRGLFIYLKDVIVQIMGPKAEYSNFLAYTMAFISNGIYGWIEEWASRGMQESGEEMTQLLKNRAN